MWTGRSNIPWLADLTPNVSPDRAGRYLSVTRREHATSRGLSRYVVTAVSIFVLALLLVTGAELVIGHPLSGGAGGTSMGALFVTPED